MPDTIWMNRGTYNQLVHLGSGRHLWAENVVAPGQSGDPASPHFSDQLALYATWRYKPMRLDRSDLTGHVMSATSLRPYPLTIGSAHVATRQCSGELTPRRGERAVNWELRLADRLAKVHPRGSGATGLEATVVASPDGICEWRVSGLSPH